jgi:hypothetical protein
MHAKVLARVGYLKITVLCPLISMRCSLRHFKRLVFAQKAGEGERSCLTAFYGQANYFNAAFPDSRQCPLPSEPVKYQCKFPVEYSGRRGD